MRLPRPAPLPTSLAHTDPLARLRIERGCVPRPRARAAFDMSTWTRRLLLGVFALALLVCAYAPLLDAGWRGADRAVLAALEAGRSPFPGSVLAAPWTHASAWLWAEFAPEGGALVARLEHLVLLGAGAFFAAVFLTRLLLPWTGSVQARAAARALCVILLVHPLAVGAVAGLEARADLLALALSAIAAAAFLKARQEHRFGYQGVAGVCAIAAGAAGELGWSLPVILGAAEFLSAHRYRGRRERLRTTTITAASYGACVGIVPLLASWLVGAPAVPSGAGALAELASPGGALRVLVLFVEKLGVLVLPANAHGAGLFGAGLAGLLILVGLQPALVAARSAPRLWGWLLVGWLVALFAASLPGAEVRVRAEDFGEARLLLGPALVLSAGLAVASTAVSGPRRVVLPGALAIGYALLAQSNAWCVRAAAQACASLEGELARARAEHGPDALLLVLDPPRRVRGESAVGDELALLDSGGEPRAHRSTARCASKAAARE